MHDMFHGIFDITVAYRLTLNMNIYYSTRGIILLYDSYYTQGGSTELLKEFYELNHSCWGVKMIIPDQKIQSIMY